MAKCKTGQIWDTKVRKCIADKSSLKKKYGTGIDDLTLTGKTRIKGKSDPRFDPKRGKSEAVASGIRTDRKIRKTVKRSAVDPDKKKRDKAYDTRQKTRGRGQRGKDPRFDPDRKKESVQQAIRSRKRRRASVKKKKK